ncbi:hemagglutinin repeat-containing protein [Pandoraea terrigena]|uniref:Hemagglutinin-related protein n=1 Tax=Pandoraea terrigena TaxID=2508292 RepID=A0A5E4XMY3_9BURK|nr:hemagglutinin repeat-containing protein [Pandoraea terrigena]VVE37841.1 hemagglutinin-related protein [Pandoraea terrigena]
MNTRCFRLIFSHVQRQWVAVGENVRRGQTPGCGRSSRRRQPGSAHAVAPRQRDLRPLWSALLPALLAFGFPITAASQIVATPGPHAPGVGTTPNGLPLVNITTPSASGVSQNQYQQFDVPTQGAILNNSRTIVQTQIGGLVPGNPNLTGAPARIIVNQVTGTLPSSLAGYLEVAGHRAEVIVSNPNGLTCDGCGFINTARGVLTTGLPVFGGSGSLDAFRVTGGRVQITGQGLNASNLTHAALLARAVEVNAAVHAQQLDVIAGLNDIDASTFGVTRSATATSGAPSFALDVSRLGGMYAGKIRLIGTEVGVGVNLHGHVTASQGSLVLNSAGQLQIGGRLHAREDLSATAAGDLSIGGETVADGALALRSSRDLVSSGTLRGARDVKLDVGSTWRHTGTVSAGRHLIADAAAMASSGAMAAGANADGTRGETGNLSLTTAGRMQAGGTHSATGDIAVIGGALDFTGATSTTLRRLRMRARSGAITLARATTQVGGATQITAHHDVIHDGATLRTSGLVVDASGLSNRGGRISQWGVSPFRLSLSGLLSNREGQIHANGSHFSLTSGHIDNTSGRIEHAGMGDLRLASGRVENTRGTLATNGTLSIDASAWRNDHGTVSAKRLLTAGIRGQVTNTGGLMQSGGLLSLRADTIRNTRGLMQSASLAVNARHLDNGSGAIRQTGTGDDHLARLNVDERLQNHGGEIHFAAGDATIAATELDNTGGTVAHAGHGTLSIKEQSFVNREGRVGTNGDLLLRVKWLTNAIGRMTALRHLNASIDANLNNASGLLAGKSVTLEVGETLDNRAGSVEASDALLVKARNVDNAAGALLNSGQSPTALAVQDKLANTQGGRIAANADVTVTAGTFDNTTGRLHAGKSLALTVASDLLNTAGCLTAGERLEINAGGGIVNRAGHVSARDALRIAATGNLDNGLGTFDVGAPYGYLRISGRQLDNAGGRVANAGIGAVDILLRERLRNRASPANAAESVGSIAGNGAVNVSANGIDNLDGARIAAGGSLRLTSTRDIDNRSGRLQADGPLTATANQDITNVDGAMHAGKALYVAAGGRLDNTRGSMETAGDPSTVGHEVVTLSSGTLDNTDGRIVNGTRGDLTITANAITNARTHRSGSNRPAGRVGGNGRVSITTFALMNGPNALISAGADLSLTVRDTLGNAGTLFSGADLGVTWRDAQRTRAFENTGTVQARRDASLAVTELAHRSGEIAVSQNLVLRTQSLLGTARLRAGNDLHVSLPGDFTYGADHAWQANGSLKLDVGGLLRVHGALGAIKQLTVNAARVVNTAQGRLRGGSVLVNVVDDITNETRIDGDDVRLIGARFTNTGAVIGGRLRFDGATFVNTGERAVLAATQQLDLFVSGDVLNENGATLYSLGNLRVAAGETRDAQGHLTQQTGRFINRSAIVEAGGDVDIATREFVNDRSYINIVRGVGEGETQTVRDVWIAGYVALPNESGSRARCAANTASACEELPTEHTSHSLGVNGEPAMIEETYEETDQFGKVVRQTRLVPNPRNQAFTQWRWGREARAALSAEKLHVANSPISVTIAKRGVTALDTDGKTFSLEHPIIELYKRNFFSKDYSTRNITQRAVQHFESITDDGQGNWVIQFWPDYDPDAHIRPTFVDQSRQTITGDSEEGVRIFRRGHGIEDGRDTNEYRRRITVRSATDVLGDVAAPGIITSQGTIRLNVDNGTALNHASTISAGGDLQVRGNNGQITSRSVALERVERIAQSSDLYWHEKSGNSDSWFTTVDLDVTERRAIVEGLPSLITSNQTTSLRGRDVTIETGTVDGTIIGSRQTDSAVGTSARVAVDTDTTTVATGTQAGVDPVTATPATSNVSGVIQTLDSISGGIPDLKLPRSALFKVVTAPDQPYLVETDSRFTDYGTFVSSNYLLELLGVDPAGIERRIGDGFYEGKLVREQVLALTGRASLGIRDSSATAAADAEFRALLAQGARAGRDLELRVGIRLTPEQMRALTDDIVWLVRQTVTLPDGSTATVLVPTVYLAHGKRVAMQPGGALVTGRDVIVEATNDLINSGQIVGDASTRVQGRDVENRGVIGGTSGLGSVGQVEVVAERDVRNIGGEIAGKQVNVAAGRDVVVASQTHTTEWVNGSQSGSATTVESRGRIGAQDSLVITAGRDLTVNGAEIDAGGDVDLAAGRDVSLGAVALSREFGGGTRDNHNYTQVTDQLTATVNTGGNVTVLAGGDASTAGTRIDAGKTVVVAAARDVEIGAAIGSITDSGRVDTDTYAASVDSYAETVRGSQVQADGGITVAAGQAAAVERLLNERGVTAYVTSGDATTGEVKILGSYLSGGSGDGTPSGTASTSAKANAGKSDVTVVATGDVTIGGISARYDDTRWSRTTQQGLLSSTTEEHLRESHGTRTTGSTLSGDGVTVASGRDVTITGSQVVADDDMTISATRNVTIASAEDRSSSLSVTEKQTSGVFGSGFGFTIGSRSEKEKQRREQVTQTGSVVGSVTGDVTVQAGNDYRQEGSTVVARDGDVTIAGKRVAIVESKDREQSVHEREVKQAGLTVAVSSPLLDAAETVGQMGKAVGKVKDPRMKALGVAAGGLAVKNAADTVKNLKDAANVTISVTVGGSKHESRETNDSTTAIGSSVRAGGNVTVSATGDGDQSSLLIRGSEIDAGQDVKLTSDGTLDILAAADTSEHHRRSTGVSGGIGLGISVGTNGTTMGVTAKASASRGKADGKDVTNRSSHITAGGVAKIASGGDTNLRGGTVVGERVVANVGGDLNIESLQDTSVYASKDQSINGSATVGFGGASGSINVSHQQVNSDFASVTEQSGIKAGDGGFDVTVKGNTDLTGAVIASTDEAADENRNRLKTGSLTTRDIENHAEYDAFGISLGGGISKGFGENAKVGTDQKGNAQTGANATPGSELPKTGPVSIKPPVVVAAGGSASSTTRSGISAGVIKITDEASQRERTGQTAEATVAAVNRDVSSDRDGSGALANQFDKEQIETSFEIMQTLQREVGTFVGNRAKEADELKKARDKETDPTKRAELDSQLVDAQKWGPGGDYRRIVTAIVAAAAGNVTAGMGDMITRGAVNYLQSLGAEKVKAIADGLNSETARAALQGIVGCAGAAASGGNCGTGAMGASASVVLNNLLDKAGGKSGKDLSAKAKEAHANLVTSVVAGIAGATGANIATASTSAKIETENNALNVNEFKALLDEAKICGAANSCDAVTKKYRKLSLENQEKVAAVCSTDPAVCKSAFGDYVYAQEDFRKALDEASGLDLPGDIKNDLGAHLANYSDAVVALGSAEFANQLRQSYGVSEEAAATITLLVQASLGSSGKSSSSRQPTNSGAGKVGRVGSARIDNDSRGISGTSTLPNIAPRPAVGTRIDAKVKLVAQEKLRSSTAETFKDGKYFTVETTEAVTLYRKFGGRGNQAKLDGGFAATKENASRQDTAVYPKWSSTRFEAVIEVPQGQKLNVGKVGKQPTESDSPKYRGGEDQVLLPRGYPVDWVRSVRDGKTGKTYTLDEFRVEFTDQFSGR